MHVILLFIVLGLWVPSTSMADSKTQHTNTGQEIVKTRLFILGTPHLSSWKDRFKPELLDSTIARLAALEPVAIMVEALPGPALVALKQHGEPAAEIVSTFGRRQIDPGQFAQEALDLKWSDAFGQVSDFNTNCPDQSKQDHCILIYLAAYEYDTALLKYVRLEEATKQTFEEKHPAIAEKFRASLDSTNEYYTVAQRLALQLDLQRIFPVDAHAEKIALSTMLAADKSIEDYFERLFGDISEHPYLREMKRREEAAIELGDLLGFYQWLNSPESLAADVAFQWTPFLEKDDDSQFGKTRLALWEMRNLLMAANMSRVMAEYPGETVVYVVGASHKSFLDAYFRGASWVEVLESGPVLEPSKN